MHILLVPSWYKTPENPIRGSFFIDQAHALQKAGHQVGMLVPPSILRTWNGVSELKRYWASSPMNLSIDDADGFPSYRVNWWGWWASLNPWARAGLMKRAFAEYVKAYGMPDILHAHSMIYGGYIASQISKDSKVPYIITEHNTRYIKGIPAVHFGQEYFVQRSLEGTRSMLAVSQGLAKHLERYKQDIRIQVVGNVVDTVNFDLSNEELPASPFVFTIIARLEKVKGHALLLEAFARKFKGKAVRLNIIGGGSQDAFLKETSKTLGIEQQVKFFGIVPHNTIPQIIHKSHAIVSASSKETFGVTIIEAMACGKPVIVTRSGGPEYIIDERQGITINYGDIDELGAAMERMVVDYGQYNSQEIRQFCVKYYSEAAIVSQLETIYHELI